MVKNKKRIEQENQLFDLLQLRIRYQRRLTEIEHQLYCLHFNLDAGPMIYGEVTPFTGRWQASPNDKE